MVKDRPANYIAGLFFSEDKAKNKNIFIIMI